MSDVLKDSVFYARVEPRRKDRNGNKRFALVMQKIIETQDDVDQILDELITNDSIKFNGELTFFNKLNAIRTLSKLGMVIKKK